TVTNASGSITLATTAPTSVVNDTNITGSIASNALTLGWTGQLGISRGGTNATTIGSAGSIAYSTGTAYDFSAVGTSGQCLKSGATGVPTWGACGISSIGDTIGSATAGSIFFAGAGGILAEDNANFFWDDTNNRLGLGTATPTANFQVAQGTAGIGTVSNGAGGTIVTGVGTQFLNTFKIGDTITINGETKTISAIASDTSMTTDAFAGANSGIAYTLTGGTRFSVLGNGNVGIGDVTPASMFTVGNGDLFQVNSAGAIVAATGITSSGTITLSGLSTAGIVTNTAGGVLGTVASIPVANGGTNATTIGSAGSIAYSTGTAYDFSLVGTAGQALISGGTGAPTFFAPTLGSVLFATTSGALAQDNANFFWDDTNNRLGLGTATPASMLDIYGASNALRLSYDGTNANTISTLANGDLSLASTNTTEAAVVIGTGAASQDASAQFASLNTYFVGSDYTTGSFMIGGGSIVQSGNAFITATSTGNIGIGTATPTAFLTLAQPSVSGTLVNAITAVGGSSTGANGIGGGFSFTGGNGNGSGSGGAFTYVGGTGGATGNGGAISITSGAGGSTSGIAGNILIAGGDGPHTTGGGSVTLKGGTYGTYGASQIVLNPSGSITMGRIALSTANGNGVVPSAGSISLITGNGNGAGTGGAISLTAGNGGTTNVNGSDITLLGGVGGGSGLAGNILLASTHGFVGIGDATPASMLSVGNGDLFQVNSAGAIAAATGITSSGTITLSGLSVAGIVTNDAGGVLSTMTSISVATGGTGASTVGGAGSIAYSDGSAYAFSAVGTAGRALISGGAGAPTFYAPTAGSLLFAGTSGILEQDNASLFFNNTTNMLGVGIAVPEAKLDVASTSTSTTAGSEYGLRTTFADTGVVTTGQDITYGNYTSFTRTGATGGTIDSYGSYVTATGSTGGASTLYGSYVTATGADTNYGSRSEASGTTGALLYGAYNIASSSTGNTITNAYGMYGKVDANSGSITNGYALYGGASASGTVSNGYGLYLEDIAATTGYGVYQAGADDHNYFAGNVGIGAGTTGATNALEVRSTTAPQLRVAYDASNYFTQSVSATGVVTFDATGAGAGFSIADNLTIGDASADTVTVNASTWTLANDTNFALSGGVNGFSVDSTTFSVDGLNHRVGIGTATPNVQLEVYGTSNAIRLAYDVSNYSTLSTSSTGELSIVSSSSSEGAIVIGNGSATDLSIQFDGSSSDYFVGRDATSTNFLIGSGMTVQDSNALLNITSTGLVGVGMTPLAKLDVTLASTSTTGATQYALRSTLTDTGIVTTGTDTTYGNYNSLTRTGATGGTINSYGNYTLLTTDDAGVGTSTAYGSYIDTGVAGATNADTVYGMYINTESNAGTTTGLYVDAGTGAGTEYSAVFMNGNVGIGTATPAYALDVLATGTGAIARFNSANNTGCTLATDGTITCSSDERLKKNIVSMTDSLSAVMALRPVEYNWKYQNDSETKNFGFIAQEVESVLPRLVITDENGYKELNTIGLVPIIAQAVQEQQTQIVSINLRTDQNVTTLNELQASVDTQLVVIGSKLDALTLRNTQYDTYFANDDTRLTDHDVRLTALDTLTDQLRLDVNMETARITLLETQMQSLTDFYTAFDLNSVIAKNATGDIDLTVDAAGNRVLLGGKLKAVLLETGGLTIEVSDPLAPTIGTAEVLPVALDANSDGNDDYTGLPMTDTLVLARDGTSVSVMTRAMIPMVNGSRIFTTWKNNPSGFSWVEKTKDAQNDFVGFQIRLSTPVTAPTKVDWLLIEQKGNIVP
ncbi:MAG: tail fiber domain-containing protein, partial [Candidatus Moranbacteria bacterium]|nr:tail fiber domain-containing protein [Candidatus Moranbacteria bacterium]